jgi:malto-oligosyltrehalose synthase
MRLQFHKGFTFVDAEKLVPYFAQLGVSHIYASPITTARPGSMHGYDVVGPRHVNPELGGEGALRSFVSALRDAGLGLIIDIVPNHMAVGEANAWWFDVLRHGRVSRYASYFDIDWEIDDDALRGKVLLPVLGKQLRGALRDGEITLAHEDDGWVARYFSQRFPISGEVREGEAVDCVLARQHYRLAWWRVANDEINWRRFFDINELAGLRMENAETFEDVHALIFRLYAEGMIDGVRVDHVDGLADPGTYCRTLRRRLEELTLRRPSSAPNGPPYIVVEKILLRGEELSAAWQTDGTSGYDFMNEVSAVQHEVAGQGPLDDLWQTVSGRSADFAVEEEAARREVLSRSFSAQLEACTSSFHRLARAMGEEATRASVRRGLIELLAHFPVYRTYGLANYQPRGDERFLESAARGAKRTCLSTDREVIDRLVDWLACRVGRTDAANFQHRAVTQFQQLSAPVAAKSVEDTAFYRYGRLLSRNDVGFDVARFSDSTADFHVNMQRRHSTFPHAMLATATHDHKRGEDLRARLAVLSEYADEWRDSVPRWIAGCRCDQPSPGDIAILLQMIVGAWPLDLGIEDDAGRHAFTDRLAQWQEKALREAKLATDWSVPNEDYERVAREFLRSLVGRYRYPALLAEIVDFAQRIAPAGVVNSLAQTLLKFTAPGVPDIYQGTERWDFSLVDPDNRRPVDFGLRDQTMPRDIQQLMATWRDGRIKQAVIARVLALRRKRPELFTTGAYKPLTVSGEHAHRVVAFERNFEGSTAITIVPRTANRMLQAGSIRFDSALWVNTAVAVQHDKPLFEAFRAQKIMRDKRPISLNNLFEALPVAMLVSGDLME